VSAEIVFGGDSTDIPAGTYPATLKSIEVKTSTAFGDFRAWDFTLEGGSVVGGASSLSLGSKSKGGRWAIALAGKPLAKGESIDLEGRACLVVVEEDANGWPKVVNVVPAPAGATETPDKAKVASEPDLPF
jgi:hypothetical protein